MLVVIRGKGENDLVSIPELPQSQPIEGKTTRAKKKMNDKKYVIYLQFSIALVDFLNLQPPSCIQFRGLYKVGLYFNYTCPQ